MSTEIDQRVVEMRFDNQQFERNVQTSISTLDKLKQGLDLSGAAKGLESISAAAGNCTMSGLSAAIQTVSSRFSSLEVIGMTALMNLTNSAVNAGKRIVSALTIDPIKAGFAEYETQINAVQTILANTSAKGTTLNQVNAALDELNTYADMTIYNFTEMTRNIGTFTAAGVELDVAVSAIKGIANLAAISGSTSQQASTAMYQLSQALASGTVKLMDWNSVVNAGMGGQVFQDALKETARVSGIAIDDMIAKEGSFRETLKHGWLTADILTQTLDKFTGDLSEAELKRLGYTEKQITEIVKLGQMANDAATKVKTLTQLYDTLKEAAQSGWTQSWEIIVGDFEEAKKLYTEISDTIGGILGTSAQARNDLLSGGLSTGWNQFLREGIADETGYQQAISEVLKEEGKSYDEIIEKAGSFNEALKTGFLSADVMSKALTRLADKTRGLSDEQLTELGYTREQVAALEKLEASVQNGSVSLEGFAEKMTQASGRENLIQSLRNTFLGLVSVVTPVKTAFRELFPPYTGEQLYRLTEGLRELTAGFTLSDTASENLKRTFKGLFAILDMGKQAFSEIFELVRPLFGQIDELGGGLLAITAGWGDWLAGLNETVKTTDVFGRSIEALRGYFEDARIVAQEAAENLRAFYAQAKEKLAFPGLAVFHAFLERAQERLGWVTEAVNSLRSGVMSAIELVEELFARFDFLQTVQAVWDGVKRIGSGLAEGLGSFIEFLVKTLGGADFSGLLDLANSGLLAAIAVGISKLTDSFTGVVNTGQGFLGSLNAIKEAVLDAFGAFQSQLNAGALAKIAGAIGVMAAALLGVSLIDSAKLTASLVAISVLFGELVASVSVFGKLSLNIKAVAKLLAVLGGVSAALMTFVLSLKLVSTIPVEQLKSGLLGIAALMATLVTAMKVLGDGSGALVYGASRMVAVAGAVVILASACKTLGGMDGQAAARGLVSVGVLLAEMAAFSKFGGSSTGLLSTGIAMIAIATATRIFVGAVAGFGKLPLTELGLGLLGVAGSLIAVGASLRVMPKDMIGIGVGLVAVSGALVVIAGVIERLGAMRFEDAAQGLVALGGAMAILAVGLRVMTGTLAGSAALLVASAAIAIFAPAMSLLGAMSWEAIARGLASIAGAFVIIGAAGLVLTPLMPTILGLGGAFALIGLGVLGVGAGLMAVGAGLAAISVGFSALAAAGASGAAAIVASLTVIISGVAGLIPAVIVKIGEGIIAVCGVIAEGAPVIGKAVKSVLFSLLDVLVECTPSIVNAVFGFIIGILDGIANNLPTLIGSAVDILMSFFSGVVDALKRIDPQVLLEGIVGVGLLAVVIAALAAVAPLIPGAMVGVLGLGAVIAELALVLAAIGALAQIPGLNWLINEGGGLLESMGVAIGGFVGGIVGGFMGGVSSQFPKIGADLAAFMTNARPFIEGAGDINAETLTGIEALAAMILTLTASNIFSGIAAWISGESSLERFGESLVCFGRDFSEYSEYMCSVDPGVVSATTNAARTMVELQKELPKEGGWFSNKKSISDFGEDLVQFGFHFKQYCGYVGGINVSALDGVIDETNKLVGMARGMSEIDTSGMRSFGESMAKLGQTGVDDFIRAFTNANSRIISTAGGMLSDFIAGVNAKKYTFVGAFTAIVNAALSAVRNSYGEFRLAGERLASGFANGIEANAYLARAQARAMASAAARAAAEVLDERSPSRVGYQIGDYFGLAFTNAIGDYKERSYQAGAGMSDAARRGLSEALSRASRFFDGELEAQPTIRPVLDLSAVAYGASQIDGLIVPRRSIELAGRADVGAFGAAGGGHAASFNNEGVVREISELRRDVSALAESIGRLKIVMDTGMLVGSLAGPLDVALGQRAVYAERRV